MINDRNILLEPAISVRHQWPVNMAENDLMDFKDQAQYSTFDCRLKKFTNSWVSPDSVVYKNGLLIKETLALRDHASYYQIRHLVKKIITGKKRRLDDAKKYLLVTDAWSSGHFHWFMDVLPKLLCIENTVHEFTLLLPDTSYIRSIGLESLKLLQLSFADIILMKETEIYKIKNLYYVSRVSKSGQIHPGLMKRMRQKFTTDNKSANRKIYISRAKAAIRKVVNEEALVDVLKDNNFEILFAEDFNLSDQVNIFSSCNTLLGIHGSGLANCIFMPPASDIIEMRRKENDSSNVGFWHLADSLDQNYYYYNGIPDSDKPLVGKGCNLTIPVSDFEKKLLSRLA